MSTLLKSDAQEIISHLDNLKQASWMTPTQSWWPDYIYHFTDIKNVVDILSSGVLRSRMCLEQNSQSFKDCASSEVIGNTNSNFKDYVRFYFRPKTPTLYHNEGMRPINQRSLDAHCPVPVYMLFDAKRVLSQSGTKFTQKNLAACSEFDIGEDAAFFKQIPFKDVYHSSYFDRRPKFRAS